MFSKETEKNSHYTKNLLMFITKPFFFWLPDLTKAYYLFFPDNKENK